MLELCKASVMVPSTFSLDFFFRAFMPKLSKWRFIPDSKKKKSTENKCSDWTKVTHAKPKRKKDPQNMDSKKKWGKSGVKIHYIEHVNSRNAAFVEDKHE